ncbi:MAG: sugar transferase [Armatimonadota bacterium]|nr:sugar transferase [bacterium]
MVAKRVFDFFSALFLLIVLSPVLILTAIGVAIAMGRPVIFRQTRPGRGGKLFTLYKFRTMRDANKPDGTPLPDGERLTRLGRILRATSVDELPELYNVLKGEMSLVGPRPLIVRYLPYYTMREHKRHSVPPGITGWAQVNGRNHASWNDRLARDVWYVENWSFWLDIRILLLTVVVVFKRSGVEVDTQSTALSLDEERCEVAVQNT